MAQWTYLTREEARARHANRMAILRHVLGRPGDSRAGVARALGLPRPTVAMLVRHLLDEGWLREEDAAPTGRRGRGARPLFVQRERLLRLRVELDEAGLCAVALGGSGQVVGFQRLAWRSAGSAPERAAEAVDLLLRLQAALYAPDRRVMDIDLVMPASCRAGDSALPHLLARRLQGSSLREVPVCLQRNSC